jgi:riboflavin synthase
MFTGIVAAIGKVESVIDKGGDMRLQIACLHLDIADVILGDSIAVNGVCLTVVAMTNTGLSFDVSRESLARSSLASVQANMEVNLEKALAVGDRLGGHFVSGHVDAVAECIARQDSARSVQFRFKVPDGLQRYIAEKGSICIDGTSLTVNNTADNWFEVNVIPHTLQETIIKSYRVGSRVNIEVDLIARYLERLLPNNTTGITKETLLKHGFIE